MLSLKGKVFWVVFPLAVTAVSVFGVSRLRRNTAPTSPPAATNITDETTTATPAAPAEAPQGTPTGNAAAPTQSAQFTIPADTELAVRLDVAINAKHAADGEPFSATLADPVIVSGQTVIPEGTEVKGKVVYAREAGRLKGVAEIRLALTSINIQGNDYHVETTTFTRMGHNHYKRNGEFIGGGAGVGALFGALLGRGKGALIGAPVGAAAGTAGDAFTEKRDLILPAETAMTFRLRQPVEVTL